MADKKNAYKEAHLSEIRGYEAGVPKEEHDPLFSTRTTKKNEYADAVTAYRSIQNKIKNLHTQLPTGSSLPKSLQDALDFDTPDLMML